MKEWKHVEWCDECPICGGDTEVLTSATGEDKACDGDEARCASCKEKGWVTVIDSDTAYIQWECENNDKEAK